MPFEIIREDITNMQTDIIVSPTNNKLQPTGGVCNAIFKKAGYENLQKECKKIGFVKTTQAIITKGYNLNCKYIIHTVGPVWENGKNNESNLLYNTYINCLNLAKQKRCKSIAFPLISSGSFGYPKDEALDIATNAIKDFLFKNDMLIYLVVFDIKSFKINKTLFNSIKQYIDDNYVEKNKDNFFRNSTLFNNDKICIGGAASSLNTKHILSKNKSVDKNLLNALSKTEDTFSESLLKLIDNSGMTDSEVYKKANIDRRLFSKIRKNKNYTPSKSTVLSLAIALELNIEKTNDLLKKAGFALSHSNQFDIIIEYFISNEIYDIYKINETLFSFEQNILKT